MTEDNHAHNCHIGFIYITPEHNPKDFLSPKVSPDHIISAITTNLANTRAILDDCQITLFTNNKSLIPVTTNAFENIEIAVENFASYSFSPEYKLPGILKCLADKNYKPCLYNLLCPSSSGCSFVYGPDDNFLFGMTVNVVKKETSINLGIITTDINTIFCGKFSEEQLKPGGFDMYPVMCNGHSSWNTPFLHYQIATIEDLQNPRRFCEQNPKYLIGDGKMGSWKHPDGTDPHVVDSQTMKEWLANN